MPAPSLYVVDESFVSSHDMTSFRVAFIGLLRNIYAPESVDVAIGIDGNRFACKADACFRWVVFFKVTHNDFRVGLKTDEADVVLWRHWMRLGADSNRQGVA